MSHLENPFRKPILPPEQTDREANAVLADTLLGKAYGDALRSLDGESDTKSHAPKQDDFSDMTLSEEELHIIEKSKEVSLIEAETILGKELFLGPKAIEQTFGFIPENIPTIPFSVQELRKAKELGMQLILNVDKTPDGTPLTIENMAKIALSEFCLCNILEGDANGKPTNYLLHKNQFNDDGTIQRGAWFEKETEILNETPNLEWQLVSLDIIEDSTSKTYLDQQELLIETTEQQFFNGNFPPNSEEHKAKEEFEQARQNIQKLIDEGKTKEASDIISQLQSSQLFREPITHTIFRYLMNFSQGKQLFTDGTYTWSNSVASDGYLLPFGCALANGASVFRYVPWNPLIHDGVVLSYRVKR